jgi:protein TonB
MDFLQPGLRERGSGPYDWDRPMSARRPLRLPAAVLTSAAVHAVVLALVLRAASTGGLFAAAPEAVQEAKLITVSLVSKPGGGGGGPLPGLPSAPPGAPGTGAPQPPPLPRVRLEPPPPPLPQPTTRAKPALSAPHLPGSVRFPTIAARDAPKAPPRAPEPRMAAPPASTAPPPVATGNAAAGDQVASLGSDGGRGIGGGAGNGRGGGGEGTGDGSGGDGSDGLARPAYGSNPKPPYPLAAKRLGVEGVVLLDVLVRADGSPAEVHVRTSSGSSLLDDSAVETVRSRWRFIPGRRGNAPVESRVQVPIRFRLDAS